MTLGSLFDGIGGWQIAAVHADIKPIWSSEIDEFPAAVTKKHFPDTIQLGDITKLDGAKLPTVDIICAGSPCQDLSIAGKREGLKGERSGLFSKSVDIVRRMRTATGGVFPRFFVWENVMGAFSSNKGHDFQTVLSEITENQIPMPESGRWACAGMVQGIKCDVAWRSLDAQYWGVAQRRRRIFLVADFAAQNRCAGEILFIPESLQRDPETREGTRQKSAAGTDNSAQTSKSGLTHTCATQSYSVIKESDTAATLTSRGGFNSNDCENIAIQLAVYDMTHANDVMRPVHGDKANTLQGRMGTGGNQIPVINSLAEKTVRKLMPVECERLQGLPDEWTNVEFKGKQAPDSKRYKAIGNGMAQPCADFVLSQIVKAVEERKNQP